MPGVHTCPDSVQVPSSTQTPSVPHTPAQQSAVEVHGPAGRLHGARQRPMPEPSYWQIPPQHSLLLLQMSSAGRHPDPVPQSPSVQVRLQQLTDRTHSPPSSTHTGPGGRQMPPPQKPSQHSRSVVQGASKGAHGTGVAQKPSIQLSEQQSAFARQAVEASRQPVGSGAHDPNELQPVTASQQSASRRHAPAASTQGAGSGAQRPSELQPVSTLQQSTSSTQAVLSAAHEVPPQRRVPSSEGRHRREQQVAASEQGSPSTRHPGRIVSRQRPTPFSISEQRTRPPPPKPSTSQQLAVAPSPHTSPGFWQPGVFSQRRTPSP